MKDIANLIDIDLPLIFLSVFTIIYGSKAAVSSIEWMFDKLGIEFKWMRKRREDHELLLKTIQGLNALQNKHEEDVSQSIRHDKLIKDDLAKIRAIVDSNASRDDQIDALMAAQRESLADRINQKYKYYISVKGIPEDEVEEFTNLHLAYKGVGGNHSGDAKYDYCIRHLPIIPVEVKLVLPEE